MPPVTWLTTNGNAGLSQRLLFATFGFRLETELVSGQNSPAACVPSRLLLQITAASRVDARDEGRTQREMQWPSLPGS